MNDTNSTRSRQKAAKNAFTEVLGDPYAANPVDGWYNTFKARSTNRSVESCIGEGRSTPNAAKPSILDFFCDVEKVIERVIKDKIVLNKFVTTYIVGDIETEQSLNQAERNRLERKIGNLFCAYKIVPVAEYFKTIRERRG